VDLSSIVAVRMKQMHELKKKFSWKICKKETTWKATYKWQDNEVHFKDKVCADVN
jgi:hypothetical protein